MAVKYNYTYLDHSGEKSSVSFYTDDIDGAGTNWGALNTRLGSLQSFVDAITLATAASRQILAVNEQLSNTPPANAFAQRELGLRFTMSDTGGHKSSFTIPAPDLSALTMAGDEVVLLDGGVVQALVEELQQGHWYDAVTGNAIASVDSARVVGRRS